MTSKKGVFLNSELTALCDNAFLSKEDNKLNIIGIFDNFLVSHLPVKWPRMVLVAVFRGTPHSVFNINIHIKSPVRKIVDQKYSIKMGGNGKANFITKLVNFPLETTGTYEIIFIFGKKIIGLINFQVNIKNSPEGEKYIN